MTIQLEYSCTEQDLKEAKALGERESFGGGPRWRSTLVMLVVLVVVGTGLFFRFKAEIAPKDRPWFIALVVVIFAAVSYFNKKTRAKTGDIVRLEISERAIIFNGENSRTEMLWSGFSKCLETPNLFALLDNSKSVMRVIPKRAFPDEKSQEWFRAQANQPRITAEPTTQERAFPSRFMASNGVAITLEYKFRDHLIRNITSWRVKAMALLMLAIMGGVSIVSFVNPPPDAVVPPGKVALMMVAAFVPIMIVVFSLVIVLWWFQQRKHYLTHHVLLTQEGIEFTEQNASGRLPWNTYKYYRETRWTFFIWNPQGSLWFMFPKRAFTSPSDLDQCRTLLQTNLKPSRWFFM